MCFRLEHFDEHHRGCSPLRYRMETLLSARAPASRSSAARVKRRRTLRGTNAAGLLFSRTATLDRSEGVVSPRRDRSLSGLPTPSKVLIFYVVHSSILPSNTSLVTMMLQLLESARCSGNADSFAGAARDPSSLCLHHGLLKLAFEVPASIHGNVLCISVENQAISLRNT